MKNIKPEMINISKKQAGIALIQILIIVAILTTVALYISKSAKQQIQMAQWAMDRSQATVTAHGAKSDVLFELLTNQWSSNKVASELVDAPLNNDEQARPWNLYNQPFRISENIVVQLQDQAGLINLHYPQPEMIKKRFRYAELNSQQSSVAEAVLLDWQDDDSIRRINGNESNKKIRNGLMPDLRELLLQNTISVEQLKQVSSDFTIYGHGHLNLMTSSRAFLAALSNENIANEIIRQRELRVMNVALVTQMMGLSTNLELYFSPGTTLAIVIRASAGETSVKQQLMVKFSPYSPRVKPPYNIMQTTGG